MIPNTMTPPPNAGMQFGQVTGQPVGAGIPWTPPSNQQMMAATAASGVPAITSTPQATIGAAPPTGLIGAEQALNTGVMGATTAINSAMSGLNQNPAQQMQADLVGANGPQAQAAAQARMQESPASKYQLEQMQRATERSAAARGGLLGGNVLTELQRNAAGIASMDYQNQFANMGEVATRQSAQDQFKAGLYRDLADTAMSAGITTAGMRTQAGQQIAQTATQAAGNISNLLNQQGVVISDMMSKDISTLTDMIYQSGMQETMNSQQLAAILANIAGGQASTVQSGNIGIGNANAAGAIGVGNAIQGGIQQGIGLYGTQPAGAA